MKALEADKRVKQKQWTAQAACIINDEFEQKSDGSVVCLGT